MAVTKILAKNHRLDVLINYAINEDKTEEQVLTAYQNCDPGHAYQQMMDTKRATGKTGGRQCYHIIQSFAPGEVTPELALEIAKEFAREYLSEYQVVIGTHVDRGHIHSHIVFNSVNRHTGKMYHADRQEYYRQIRTISDRLCREHGLSVIMRGEVSKSMSYYEWMRQQKGHPTKRSMLLADLDAAMEIANDIGNFFSLVEDMGYEIKHGANRISYRFRGDSQYICPERKNPKYSEESIRAAIAGNLMDYEAGIKTPFYVLREYRPYKYHPKFKGFLALYVHYLYVLGKIKKQEYPPRITPELRAAVLRFEQLKEQFKFLNAHGIETEAQLDAYQADAEKRLQALIDERKEINYAKKRKSRLFAALSAEAFYLPAKELYERGNLGMEEEYQKYLDAKEYLDRRGVSREALSSQRDELYTRAADVNRAKRAVQKEISMCEEIRKQVPVIEWDLYDLEPQEKEVKKYHDIDRR